MTIQQLIIALEAPGTKNKVVQVESLQVNGNTIHVFYISDKEIEIIEIQRQLEKTRRNGDMIDYDL